ncbi:MAG: biotin--[acetyl-CoA-carboxylase] ligase [Endomicrobium sp.]|jgi:BirA family biotin operon repressor/biotin-[acetyl-CoA-carboxylase] ligase|nr:biotin--[acetyl-CoA-carboxylase] ligase [Endomicrobium sp.]
MNVLKILKTRETVSASTVCEVLEISRASVHKQINALKKIGYKIKSSTKGYSLAENKSFFNEHEIESELEKSLSVCKTLKYYNELPSTQTTVKTLAVNGFKEGVVVVAEKQTNGYGRIKRAWSSNSGGLWFSILLNPSMRLDEVSKMALLISIAFDMTLKQYNVISEIKWPNDILINGKKLAGIIIEMSAEQNKINWVVAGVGININNKLPKKLEGIAVSLKNVLGQSVDRSKFLVKFLTIFDDVYVNFQVNGFRQFVEEYNNKMAYKGEHVSIDDGYSIITGINLGVDDSGRLIIDTGQKLEKIISGTLRVKKEMHD